MEFVAALCGATPVWGSLLLGLFVAGAAGSTMHCVPMCGGFVLGQVADGMARVPAARLCQWQRVSQGALLPYHLGRLTTYAGLGALSGAAIGQLPRFVSAALLLLGAALFAAHVARLLPRRRPSVIARSKESSRRPLPRWRPTVIARSVATKQSSTPPGLLRPPRFARRPRNDGFDGGPPRLIARVATRASGGYALGLALGFLPCGLLYAALATTAASGSPLTGALGMLCFGLGTVPALLAVGIGGMAASQRWRRGIATLAPVVMLFNAVLLTVLALQGSSIGM